MDTQTYKSRISPVLWSITWAIVAVTFFITINSAVSTAKAAHFIVLAIIWIPTIAFMLAIMLGVRYHLNPEELIIKIGPVTERRLKPQNIWSLERSYNAISSPANSLRRIKIIYSDGWVLISPKREQEFLRHLKSINPNIRILNLKC